MRTLGWIAIGGIGIGIASLSLAYALGGRDLHRLPFDLASSCGDGAKGGPSVRRLAWDRGDTIELSLPGTVYFRGGQGSDIVVQGIARSRRQCRGERRPPDARLPRMGGRTRSRDHVAGPSLPSHRRFRIGQARDGECQPARPRPSHQWQRHGPRPGQRRSGDDQGFRIRRGQARRSRDEAAPGRHLRQRQSRGRAPRTAPTSGSRVRAT